MPEFSDLSHSVHLTKCRDHAIESEYFTVQIARCLHLTDCHNLEPLFRCNSTNPNYKLIQSAASLLFFRVPRPFLFFYPVSP